LKEFKINDKCNLSVTCPLRQPQEQILELTLSGTGNYRFIVIFVSAEKAHTFLWFSRHKGLKIFRLFLKFRLSDSYELKFVNPVRRGGFG
jgi:hypothetical protein